MAGPTTYNIDIDGLCRRINRFIKEVCLAPSSGVSQVNPFDVARAQSYITALRDYEAFVVAQPQLDMPETARTMIQMLDNPVVGQIENESLYDIAVMLSRTRDELVNSQSSRLASNLMPADNARFVSFLDKMDSFIKGYVLPITPLDLPESSPMEPMAPQGASGV